MNIDLFLVIGIIILFIALSYIYVRKTKEYFQTNESLDSTLLGMAESINSSNKNLSNEIEKCNGDKCVNEEPQNDTDLVRRTDIERAARAATMDLCPVSSEYNPNDYINKSEIDLEANCAPQPNLNDYVLKTTIPPIQKCPSCICPKVKLEAGLCKKCPTPVNNCPKPKPCGIEQCRDVIKCEPWEKQVSCPKCPAPEPCPKLPTKVCPSIEIPKQDITCPEPKPCAMPGPCKDGDGRCPKAKCPKCTFKGVDTVVQDRSIEETVNELLDSEDPKLRELLEKLKNRLNLNENSSPSESINLKDELNNIINNNIPKFESAPTEPNNSLNVKYREIANSEIGRRVEPPSYNVNNEYFKFKKSPKGFNGECKDNYCPYNTNLNI